MQAIPATAGYMIAAYIITGAILVGYAVSLYLRARRALRP